MSNRVTSFVVTLKHDLKEEDARKFAEAISLFDGAVDGDEFWLNGTLEMMRRCDGVLLIDGWTRSTGACEEQRQAAALGIPLLSADGWSNRGGSHIHEDVAAWIGTLKPRFTHAAV